MPGEKADDKAEALPVPLDARVAELEARLQKTVDAIAALHGRLAVLEKGAVDAAAKAKDAIAALPAPLRGMLGKMLK
jgi:hypothetical protein